jgi:hypothetical protein
MADRQLRSNAYFLGILMNIYPRIAKDDAGNRLLIDHFQDGRLARQVLIARHPVRLASRGLVRGAVARES